MTCEASLALMIWVALSKMDTIETEGAASTAINKNEKDLYENFTATIY